MGLKPPELTEGMKAALALTAVGLADPLPAEEIVQCGAVLAIALARFCDPIKCQFDADFKKKFPVRLPPAWPKATPENAANLVKGDVPPSVIRALDKAMRAQAWLNSYGMAMLKTVFRRYSARVAGDFASESTQKNYHRKLYAELEVRTRASETAWRDLLKELKSTKVKVGVVKPAQVARLQKQIWDLGFPEREAALLKWWQLSDVDIHWLRIVAATTPPPRGPVTFTEMVSALIALTGKLEFCDCTCVEEDRASRRVAAEGRPAR